MKNELLLLHGIGKPCGCLMGGKKMQYYDRYNPITHTKTRRRYKRSMRGIGATPELKASFDAVKDIAILAAISAISAVAVDYLFNSIKYKDPKTGVEDPTKNFLGLEIGKDEDYLARAGVGILASILYKKFIEKGKTPKVDIATGMALGPTVVSAYGIFSNMLKAPTMLSARPKLSGLERTGYIEPIRATGFKPALAGNRAIAAIGAQQVGREGGFRPQLEPLRPVSWGAYGT